MNIHLTPFSNDRLEKLLPYIVYDGCGVCIFDIKNEIF